MTILEELDTKQRQIRSLRGFFLYALEIMVKPWFQERILKFYPLIFNLSFGICGATVKTILRQNKKKVLLEFLFGSQTILSATDVDMIKEFQSLKEKMEILQNQVNSLQEKVIHLENQRNLNVLSEAQNIRFKRGQRSEQGNYTLEVKKDDSRLGSEASRQTDERKENPVENRSEATFAKRVDSNILSDAPKTSLNTHLESEQYNLSSRQKQPRNEPNFVTLSQIS